MKKKKTKTKKQKDVKPSFPKKLNLEQFFASPIWYAEEPSFVDSLNKASDPYIEASKKRLKPAIDERNKKFGNKGDMGNVFHSTSLIGDPNFAELQNYVGATAYNLLEEMGFDLTNYQLFTTEMWVQEFAKKGGGHHSAHIHWNQHVSGFYFLKCSDKTSYPIFHEPKTGARTTKLKMKSKLNGIWPGHEQFHIKPKPGLLVIFPGYLEHEFAVDHGNEPFRFIHWNLQAVPKEMARDVV